ncbi:MAG: hypothetical protein ABIQ79_01400 [Nitrospiraceae bacterium]|jgi:uncharacterized lipoprotein
MSIVTVVVLSVLLFIVTGCATSSDPSTPKREAGKKDSTTKIIKRDEGKGMNEESRDAVR